MARAKHRTGLSLVSAGNASLPGRPPSPCAFFFAAVTRGVAGRCCARRCDIAVRLPHSVAILSCFRFCRCAKMRGAPLFRTAAFKVARARCQCHKTFPPMLRRQRLAARPAALAPHLFHVRRPWRYGALMPLPCALPNHAARASHPGLAASKDAAELMRRAAASKAACAACQICRPFSPVSAVNASLLGPLLRPTSSSRPSPAAPRGVVAHDDVISPCALPHHVACASRFGLAACTDAARVVAPRPGIQS